MFTKYFFNQQNQFQILRFFLLGFLILSLGVGVARILDSTESLKPASKPKACQECNVLLIDIDILRADALTCYGYFRGTTPNICNFAKEAVLFEDNYAQSTWTMPSAFSTITSLYPTFHRMGLLYIDVFTSEVATLPKSLRQAGYRTILITKNENKAFLSDVNNGVGDYDLVTDQPVEIVLEELKKSNQPWFVHYYRDNLEIPYLVSEKTELIDQTLSAGNIPTTELDFKILANAYIKKHYLEIFQPAAIAKYPQIILGASPDKDLLIYKLFVELKIASENTQKPDEFLTTYMAPPLKAYLETIDLNQPADLAYVRMMYDTKLKQLDTELGQLLDDLSSQNYTDNTISILMSDHGEIFGEHGKFAHVADQHSQLFYTPLIIKAPNLKPQRISQPTSNLDIYPTIIDFLNLPQPTGLQGLSLISFFEPNFKTERQFILSQEMNGAVLQNKTWFYYLPEGGEIGASVLYNKVLDPHEDTNVAKDQPDLVNNLFKQADLYNSYTIALSAQAKSQKSLTNIKLDPKKVELLKKEGYF